MAEPRPPREDPPAWRIAATLLGALVLGIPLVAWLWETLNEVLSLHVDARRLLISIPLLALLGVLIRAAARAIPRA